MSDAVNDLTDEAADEAAGLYLHLPFCSEICPYCDFAVVRGGRARRAAFARDLEAEIDLAARARPRFAALSFDTVYLGGGTPSHLEPEALERLLAAARSRFPLRPDARLFFEANPEDVSAESLAAWRASGVSFLSLGVQSFDARELAFLGRRHTPADARAAVEQALAAGFETVSIDLIFALPDQDPAVWRHNLETAARLGVQHVSCYELEIHRRTVFGKLEARGELDPLAEDRRSELFFLTHRLLAERGFAAYEVSNFARGDRHRSRHNRKYWRHLPYLGLGPSAHSFAGRRRFWNERSLPRYGARVRAGRLPEAGSEELSDRDLALETVMLGLRTPEGVDLEALDRRLGLAVAERNRALLERAQEAGLLALTGGRLVPTLAGLAVADRLAAELDLGEGARARAAS